MVSDTYWTNTFAPSAVNKSVLHCHTHKPNKKGSESEKSIFSL